MASGTVKWFNCRKGYGFIEPDDNSKDVFVHACQVELIGQHRLFDGQRIGFEYYEDRGRIAAGNLKLL